MEFKTYKVTLTGATPFIMHADNIAWRDHMKEWEMQPGNKKGSVAGDDRSPAWRWLGYCYHDGNRLCVPADNLMTMLREGGKKVPTGKRGASFKAATQSSLLVNEVGWPMVVSGGRTVAWQDVLALEAVPEFAKHEEAAAAMGFCLFVKSVKVGQAKHVRVRPTFDTWSCSGTISLLNDTINADVLRTILEQAGAFVGMGDWRPGGATPGAFGRFTATVE